MSQAPPQGYADAEHPAAEDSPRVLMVLKRSAGNGGLQLQARRVMLRMLETEARRLRTTDELRT